MDSYKFLAYANAFLIYATIVVGGYVTATGSGRACPDWPTCHGQIIPVFTPAVVIEYAHRLVALLAGVFFLAVTIFSWLRFRGVPRLVASASVGFALLIIQVLWGMVTVVSGPEPAFVAVHLGLATAIFGTSVILALLAHGLKG